MKGIYKIEDIKELDKHIHELKAELNKAWAHIFRLNREMKELKDRATTEIGFW